MRQDLARECRLASAAAAKRAPHCHAPWLEPRCLGRPFTGAITGAATLTATVTILTVTVAIVVAVVEAVKLRRRVVRPRGSGRLRIG